MWNRTHVHNCKLHLRPNTHSQVKKWGKHIKQVNWPIMKTRYNNVRSQTEKNADVYKIWKSILYAWNIPLSIWSPRCDHTIIEIWVQVGHTEIVNELWFACEEVRISMAEVTGTLWVSQWECTDSWLQYIIVHIVRTLRLLYCKNISPSWNE